MADLLTDLFAYDDIEANGGTQQAVVPLPFTAVDSFELDGEERATFQLHQADASFASVTHESVLRAEYADGEVQEWRVREIRTARGSDNSRLAEVICESIMFDLIHNSDILERVEKNGDVANHFELYGLTPTQHATKILDSAPSYFALGTIEDISTEEFNWKEGVTVIRERVDMIYHNDSPLSALRELAAVSGLELEVTRNAAVDYKINLWRQRASTATLVTITHAVQLLEQQRTTLSSDMGTQVYPRGGQEFGNEGSMANHSWLIADLTGSTIDFHEELFSEDDQLNGFYIEDSAGAFIEITDTVAPRQIVLASAPDFSNHSRCKFRREIVDAISGTVYGALTFLPSPAAQATYGKKPALLDRPDIPLIDNLVPNPFLHDEGWTGDIPNGYQIVGSPTVLKNTDQLYTRHGGASLHVTTAAVGSGIETKPFRVIPTESNPFLTLQAQLYVVTGNVRMELIDVTNDEVFPPVGRDAATVATDVWIDSFGVAPGGDPEDNFFTRGTQMVKARLTAIGDTAAEFYLDSLQLTQTPSFTTVIYGGRASNDLWLLAKEALEQLITPSAEYDVAAVDFNRINDVATPDPIVVGGDVTLVDTELGLNFTTRILSRQRNLLVEGETQIEVEGKTNDLTRITGQTDRRVRAALGGAQGTLEGEELQPRPPDSTDNLLAACCTDAEAENCSPDSAGAWENEPTCDIVLGAGGLSIGNSVAWSAAMKTTVTDPDAGFEGEVNDAGTLKKTVHGVLLQDALDTKDNVVDDVGTSTLAGGKLTVNGGARIRFTGFTAAATIVAQVRFGAGLYPWKYGGLIGRMDATGDGFGNGEQSPPEGDRGLIRLDAGVPTWLDTGIISVGGGTYPESQMKVFVKDSEQHCHVGGGFSWPNWAYDGTDATQNGQTGTAGFIVESGGQRFVIWDLIVCPSNEITVSGLDTGFKVRCAGNTVTETAGSATVDLGSALFPISTVEILNGSDVVQASLSPTSGIYGGSVFVYDSGGALTGESTFDVETQVQLDFLEADLTPISIATMPTGSRSATYERLEGSAIIPALTGIIRVMHRRIGTTKAISCAKEIMVNIGATPAPWVPCELQEIVSPSGGAYADALAARGHELILNYEWGFTSPGYGDYWGERPSGTGEIDAATPTEGQIDFILDINEWARLEQVDDPSQTFPKDADSTNYRLVPVTPEDVITVSARMLRSATPTLLGAWTDIEYFDIDKVAIGPALPGNGVQWLTDVNHFGRQQWKFYVGDPAHSNSPEDIRYVRFQMNASSSPSATGQDRLGIMYYRAWANLPDINASAWLEIQDDGTVDLLWTSQSDCHFAYLVSTTGFPQIADDAEFLWYTETEYIWNKGTYSGSFLAERDRIEDIIGRSIAQGETVYVAWVVGDHNNTQTSRPDRIMGVEYLSIFGDPTALDTEAVSSSDGIEFGDTGSVVVDTDKVVSGDDGLKLGDTGSVGGFPLRISVTDGLKLGDVGANVADYTPPTADLVLDANADDIPDADGATITAWANAAAGNDFHSVTGTPTVHDSVYNGHRTARFIAGEFVRFTADNNHITAASIYVVVKVTADAANQDAVELYSAAGERNGFVVRRTASDIQAFWNNETGWKNATSGTPTIDDNVLYTRGWLVWGTTTIDWKYISNDEGTPVVEEELISGGDGMEDFDRYNVGVGLSGDIARLLIYDVKHSDVDAAAIVAGLRLMYGST